ncbi:MAG TPA: DUF1580 domain-containing protein [Thermoguttaceae bacterium]|nr:DUF1580 domain-containing protein [Thermoguttaceae bacterium]
MIDLARETIVTLSNVPRHLPRRRKGKRPNVATIYHWAQRGCKGICLETIQVGGTKCTSLEALQRFCDALTPSSAPSTAPPTSRARQRSIAKAEAELAAAGI